MQIYRIVFFMINSIMLGVALLLQHNVNDNYAVLFNKIDENYMSNLLLHFQFVTLLKDPVDSWTKAMAKIAEDAVHRMFDYLPMVDSSKRLDKELLLECLVRGKSSSKFLAEIKNKKRAPGRQIHVKQSKDPYLTSDLFELPLVVQDNSFYNIIKFKPDTDGFQDDFYHR